MATKKKRPTASRQGTAAGGKQGEMTAGDMNRPVKEGLMEMPSGAEMHGGQAGRGGGPAAHAGMQTGLMPGEGTAGGSAQGQDMPGGNMEST